MTFVRRENARGGRRGARWLSGPAPARAVLARAGLARAVLARAVLVAGPAGVEYLARPGGRAAPAGPARPGVLGGRCDRMPIPKHQRNVDLAYPEHPQCVGGFGLDEGDVGDGPVGTESRDGGSGQGAERRSERRQPDLLLLEPDMRGQFSLRRVEAA